MYTPRGFGVSELGDIEIVPNGEVLHLFHLTLPNHDVVQHAVSRDGLSWSPLPAALRTGDPGAVDDDQIWTMSVTRRPNDPGYVMLYTALATADDGRVQRVCAATSNDLIHWTKSARNPVAQADPRWYEALPGLAGSVSWRDPKPTRVGERFYATVAARQKAGPLPRRGCVGLLASDDLERWEVRPPLFAPRRYWDLECPQLVRLGGDGLEHGWWYLLASIREDRSLRYWCASEPDGPFHIPPGGDLLAPPGHYAARIARWQAMDLLFAWRQPALQRGWLTTPQSVDWLDARNPFGKFLAPPMAVVARDDGSLALRSFPGWEAYRGSEWRVPAPGPHTLFGLRSAGAWRVDAAGAMDLLAMTCDAGDFIVEGTLALDGARGGLALRLDEEGSGLYLDLAPGSRTISLQRWGTRQRDLGQSRALTYDTLQQADLHTVVREGSPLSFRLLSIGPYIEASFGGEVAIATMTGHPASGSWGIWVDDGACALTGVRWATMAQPQSTGTAGTWQAEERASVD